MHLENEIWQKIPGTVNSYIYPFIRKPSITGSNTFIVRSGQHLLVIEPGAICDQMEKVKKVLSHEISGPDHPVIVVAGHIHVDHLLLGITDRRFRSMARILFAAEDWGAKQLEEGNPYWTGSDVVEVVVQPVMVDLHLLTQQDKKTLLPRTVELPGYGTVILKPFVRQVENSTLFGQSMPLSCEDTIEFWHTPGHSSDSLSIRIGKLVHIGDIPFSVNLGIAGRPGWNREELLRSVISIRNIFAEDGCMICCLGHGKALTRKGTIDMLDELEHAIHSFPLEFEFDQSQLNFSMWHGLDLIEEARRIFPIIAGRILYLRYQLEEIGMDEEADTLSALYDDELIDSLLSDFITFYQEFKDGKKIKFEVVLKILQILERIQETFQAGSLSGIIDLSMVRRATRLFSDLLGTIHGTIPSGNPERLELFPFLHDFVVSRMNSVLNDNYLLSVVEDESAYRQAMVSRISHNVNVGMIEYHIDGMDFVRSNIWVMADKTRLFDFLSGLSEFFERISVQKVTISVGEHSGRLMIVLTPYGTDLIFDIPIPGAVKREIQYAGGRLISVMEPGCEDIRFTLQIADI